MVLFGSAVSAVTREIEKVNLSRPVQMKNQRRWSQQIFQRKKHSCPIEHCAYQSFAQERQHVIEVTEILSRVTVSFVDSPLCRHCHTCWTYVVTTGKLSRLTLPAACLLPLSRCFLLLSLLNLSHRKLTNKFKAIQCVLVSHSKNTAVDVSNSAPGLPSFQIFSRSRS